MIRKAINPPIRGQYTGGRLLRVQRDLLGGRRERPGDLKRTFLAKHEPQLARRLQAVRVSGAKGRAGTGSGERTQVALVKKTVLARRLDPAGAPGRHR
jgi:hypothetical protein